MTWFIVVVLVATTKVGGAPTEPLRSTGIKNKNLKLKT